MLPFHNEPVIRKNIIAKILFASCSVKFSYHENFHVYSIQKGSKRYSYKDTELYVFVLMCVQPLLLPHFVCVGLPSCFALL